MSKHLRVAALLALASLAPPLQAASDADLADIRSQIRTLKDEYEARIRALEERLKEAESRAAPVAAAPFPPPAASSANAAASAFNPALSLVLQGRYANLSRDPAGSAIPRGFSLAESELTLSANVDERFAGKLTVALSPQDEVSVEEAYGIYTAAPFGLVPKFGRFLSGIGYLNEQHQHAWDFVDAPLVYQAFLAGQYAQDGLQLKWIAPLEQFVELGAEAGNGDAFPGSPRDRNGVGSTAFYAHTGGDIGDSHSWRAGVSWLRTRSDERAAKNDTGIADFVWKWAPGGNARQTNFKLQGEYFRGREAGAVPRESAGWYMQGVYQFMPRWRVAARYDKLDPASGEFDARRYSAMLDWSPSEFSRLRLQLARSRTLPDVTDNQWFVQYILSLGAHGAHKY